MTRTLRSKAMLSVLAGLLLAVPSLAEPSDEAATNGSRVKLANRSDAVARAVLVIPRAEAERCFRLIHGIAVEGMTEAEKEEAFAVCKLRMPAPPAESEGTIP